MVTTSTKSLHHEIGLRIPGRWRRLSALADALPAGFSLTEDAHLAMPDGRVVELFPHAADAVFPEIFATSCRPPLSRRAMHRLRRYTINACLVGPAGSDGAARAIVRAATALVRAGGMGVFIDNSLLAFEAREWLELVDESGIGHGAERGDAEDREGDRLGLLGVFVNLIGSEDDIWTLGMHALGLRDAVVARSGDDRADQVDLLDFIAGTRELEECPYMDGDVYGGRRWSYFLQAEPCTRVPAGSPAHNPYGKWRLERIP